MHKSNYLFFLKRKYQFFSLLIDSVLMSIIFLLQPFLDHKYSNFELLLYSVIFLMFWNILSYVTGRYHPQKNSYYTSFLKDIVIKIPFIFLLINSTFFLLRTFDKNIFLDGYEIINFGKIIIYVFFIVLISLYLIFSKRNEPNDYPENFSKTYVIKPRKKINNL